MKYTKDLNYFLDKYCTIMTRDVAWHFKVENMMDYFTGVIHSIDESHIWTEHPKTGCKNCISLDYIVSIAEEQFLSEENPDHQEIINEYRNKNPVLAEKTKVPPKQDRKHVNIEELNELSG